MVVTQRKIMEKKEPILFVLHDKDGDWQFLAADEFGGMDQVVELALNDIIKMDSSIAQVAELPQGWKAIRRNTSLPWTISIYRPKEFASSSESTQRIRSDTIYNYHFNIHTNDSGYVHGISISIMSGLTISYENLIGYDEKKLFFGYDSTILGFEKRYVIPYKVGLTKVYLRNPNKLNTVADSIEIEVLQGKTKLYLHKRAP
jgi:hypothetical protein